MNLIVVGAGKVGYYLVKTLLARGNNVAVVEKERERCERLAQELGVLVIQGDGTAPQALADAQADRAEVIAAVTGRDEDNLVACQVAKRLFGVGRAIARVNNPKNEAVLEALGVDAAVSSTSL
ncbi:MAG TPA: TrkA family potassium uptake protein, partial [Firmicutes bacterium]|nr:TrkA family potassium uptake protein [Bacillota bacterium]